MKKLTLLVAILPGLALAAPTGTPPRGPGAGQAPDPARLEHMQKRMRLARTLGLAEALDLDEAGAMRIRDVMAKYDAKRTPLHAQLRDNFRILKDAARGDQAAAGQVDTALQRLRDARTQLQAVNADMFKEISQGLTPEKKARAVLFLARFHERAHRMGMGMGMMRHGPGGEHGPMRGPGPRGGGMGMMMDRGGEGPGPAFSMGDGNGEPPDVDEWFGDE